MDKNLLQKLEEDLKKDEQELEKNLKTFASKDKKLKGDWDTNFPQYSEGGSDSELDITADEVEDYSNLLPVEHVLEIRLENVSSALKKIKTDKYGLCEKCKKEISLERLKVSPEVKFCIDCKKSSKKI